MKTSQELEELIELRQIDAHTFQGDSITVGSESVFGGQVLAQALNAAYRTVPEDRNCHSLHSYFILRGDLNKPITYKVQLVRDGGSFTTRYVTAEQEGVSIFVLAASFQIKEEGLEFQEAMPEVPQPEELMSWEDIYEQSKDFLPENMKYFLGLDRPITFKPTVIHNPFEKKDLDSKQNVWFRINDVKKEITTQLFHQLLAYTSDYNILFTALRPHASEAHFGNMVLASLDHAMWFHREPEDPSDWFLFTTDVLSNSNARGLTTGQIFSRKGRLIASVCQEGMLRKLKK